MWHQLVTIGLWLLTSSSFGETGSDVVVASAQLRLPERGRLELLGAWKSTASIGCSGRLHRRHGRQSPEADEGHQRREQGQRRAGQHRTAHAMHET
jgi:hypothetical protein